jgi:small subunit ribosomal protein S20
MPIIKSAIKRSRQQVKRRRHNLAVKLAVKQDTKAVIAALNADAKTAATALSAAASEIDRAVKKGVLHKNTAARRKSRLSKAVTQAFSPDSAKTPAAKATAPKSRAATGAKKAAAKKPAAKRKPTKK